ncbi:hypothetical protein LAD64_26760 [Klebsiella pneumoniae]|nr:hypothetical protein [Klebsiella pneumoniae]
MASTQNRQFLDDSGAAVEAKEELAVALRSELAPTGKLSFFAIILMYLKA